MVRIRLNGTEYPAAANFNAVAAYLRLVGRDTIAALMDISKLSPSDCPALVAACVNEGLRLEGREERLSPDEVGASAASIIEVPEAVAEIFKELAPGASGTEEKKKV